MHKSLAALLVLGLWNPGGWVRAAEDPPAATGSQEEDDDDEDEEEDLRERLTEREDKRRPERSWSTEIADRPLTISGELEIEPRFVRRRVIGPDDPDAPPVKERDRLLVESGVEVEAFYSFGSALSIFAQARLPYERDLLPGLLDEVSDLYVEPGEIWLYSEDVAGTGLDFEIGRLDFEDARRWWWDEELDAVRLAYEGEAFELALAAARPLLSDRTDQGYVDPERERVFRVIGQASWDWRPHHGLELFAVHQDDRSRTEPIDSIVKTEREDESDARLRWLGARALGVFDLRPHATLGYWLDTAWVRGDERFLEFDDEDEFGDPLPPGRSRVQSIERRHVRGFAYDAGVSYALSSVVGEPRLFGGYARASREFRQTGLEGNEAGFGGVERFPHYGALLDPELSNLGVATLGAGVALLRSSSLDLVYHRYRLRDDDAAVPGIALEGEVVLNGRDLGDEIDLVLALEEWERLELAFAFAAFRAGHDFDPRSRGEISFGAFFAVRFAF